MIGVSQFVSSDLAEEKSWFPSARREKEEFLQQCSPSERGGRENQHLPQVQSTLEGKGKPISPH